MALDIALTLDSKGFVTGVKRAKKATAKLDKDWSKFVTGMNQGLQLMTRIGRWAFTALNDVFETSAKSASLSNAVEKLAGGAQQAAEMIDAMKEGTMGLVPNMELMKQASTALNFGIVKNAKEMKTLAQGGLVLARAMGTDASKGVSDLAIALGRGSNRILDNLGILLPLNTAYQEFGERIGKTTKQMTEAEKTEAFRVIALERIAEKMETLGGLTLTAGDQWAILKAQLTNTTDELKITATEGLGPLVTDLAALSREHGPAAIQFFRGMIATGGELKGLFTDIGEGFGEVTSFLGGAFDSVKRGAADLMVGMGVSVEVADELVNEVQDMGVSALKAFTPIDELTDAVKEAADFYMDMGAAAVVAASGTEQLAKSTEKAADSIFEDTRGGEDRFWADLTSDLEAETRKLEQSSAPDDIAGTIHLGIVDGVLAAQPALIDGLSGLSVQNKIARNLGIAFSRSIQKATSPANLEGLGLDEAEQERAQGLLGELEAAGSQGGTAIINAVTDGDLEFAKRVAGGLQDEIKSSKQHGGGGAAERRGRRKAEEELLLLKRLLNALGVTPQGFASGSGGFQDFGTETIVALHGKEAVVRTGGADADTVLGAGALDDLSSTAIHATVQTGLLGRIAAALERSGSDAVNAGRAMIDNSNARARSHPGSDFRAGA